MQRLKTNKGFTLIELLVTLAIIGLLATLSMAGVNYARQKAKIAKAQHEINQIYKAIGMFTTDTGVWPNHQQYNTVCSDLPGGCPANNELCGPDVNGVTCVTGGVDGGVMGIILDDSGNPYDNWNGPYMPRMPVDAWNHEYFFDSDYFIHLDGTPCHDDLISCIGAVVIGSYGPDGIGDIANALNESNNTMGAGNQDDIIKIIK